MADARSPYYQAEGPDAAASGALIDACGDAIPFLAAARERVAAGLWSPANAEDREALERAFEVAEAVARLATGRIE